MIDEEVERILRDEENRTRTTLTEHRAGLVAVAEALLERETVDGQEVDDLVDIGDGPQERGSPHGRCAPTAPKRSSRPTATAIHSATTSSNRAVADAGAIIRRLRRWSATSLTQVGFGGAVARGRGAR